MRGAQAGVRLSIAVVAWILAVLLAAGLSLSCGGEGEEAAPPSPLAGCRLVVEPNEIAVPPGAQIRFRAYWLCTTRVP